MYDFIDLVRLGIYINGLMAVIIGFFAVVKQVTVALDLFKSLDWALCMIYIYRLINTIFLWALAEFCAVSFYVCLFFSSLANFRPIQTQIKKKEKGNLACQ